MVPGLGLYLDELLFNKYNKNVIYENQKTINIEKKKQNAGGRADRGKNTGGDAVVPSVTMVEDNQGGTVNSDESDRPSKLCKMNDGTPLSTSSAPVETQVNIETASSTCATTTSTSCSPVAVVSVKDDTVNETLDWLNKPELKPEFETFKRDVIYQSIFKQVCPPF